MGILKCNKSEVLFTNNEQFDEFKTLKHLFIENGQDVTYGVKGVFTYESTYGKGCFVKSDGFNISLPSNMVETVTKIREDKESVDEINNGTVGIKIYTYTLPEKYPDKKFYNVNFVEMGA